VSLVDEAHALVNTESEHGVGFYGFDTRTGPQAYHIIRCSRVTLFFVDPKQNFRSKENTTVEDIKGWAAEFGAKVQTVSLNAAQYRCAGSVEYVDWVEGLLEDSDAETNRSRARKWYKAPRRNADGSRARSVRTRSPRRMHFEVYSDPFKMERELLKLTRDTEVRLASSYSRPWKSKRASDQRKLSRKQLDFYEAVRKSGRPTHYWTRRWNFVKGTDDYTGFIARRAGFRMHADPLSEVGSPVAIRGFDFDYLGILWLDDLRWRNGRWVVDLSHVHESGIRTLVQRARRAGPTAEVRARRQKVLEKVCQVYRILMTRAIRGVLAWIPDRETRQHVENSLSRGPAP
jgi:hypothetical protein